MGPMRTMAAVACSALLLAPVAATAQTPADRTTFVTFSGPVSIPGKTLPAGTYTFRIADSPSNLHIVQVFDKEQSKIYATILAVPADRMEAEGDPVITFKETPSDRPPAVHYWYYAGDRMGNEFVYPKSQAMSIARASGESVMSVDTDSSNIEDWKKSQTSRVTADMAQQSDANASSSSAAAGTAASTTPSSSTTSTTSSTTTSDTSNSAARPSQTPASTMPTGTDQSATSPAPRTQQPATTAPDMQPAPSADRQQPVGTSGRSSRSELPHTASEMPLVALLGMFALAGAVALRVARRANV
jgi:hypothetical protein